MYLHYKTLTDSLDKIKLDINYLSRVHINNPVSITTHSVIFQNNPKATILSPVEILAEKIIALIERTKARDVFDVHTLSQINVYDTISKHELRKNIVFHAALHGLTNDDLINSIQTITGLPYQAFKQDVQSTIRRNQGFFDADTIKRNAALFTGAIFTGITNNESLFLDLYQSLDFRPELLFPEKAERLKRHPKYLADKIKADNLQTKTHTKKPAIKQIKLHR